MDENESIVPDAIAMEFYQKLEEESKEPLGWWWLSFAATDVLDGEDRFRGVAIVPGRGALTAARVAGFFGLNPGGDVACYKLEHDKLPDDTYRLRLLTREEVEAAFGDDVGPPESV